MARRRQWLLVICVSLALLIGGAVAWTSLVRAERTIRFTHQVPPHRGASTTLAGMAIGLGLGGIIIGAAALMPTRK